MKRGEEKKESEIYFDDPPIPPSHNTVWTPEIGQISLKLDAT